MISVKVIFFANFKEILDCSETSASIDKSANVETLCRLLAKKSDAWLSLFDEPEKKLKVAVNQQMADLDTQLKEGDEVAFFPPVTGG